MATQELNLRDLLEQDRQLCLEILELSHKLILDVEATHYWLKQCLDHFKVMGGIAVNLSNLFDSLDPHWGDGSEIHKRPEGAKLWKTAIGLYRALQPVRGQLQEQISRRRRQRIMGEELIEPEEIDPGVLASEIDSFKELFSRLSEHFTSLQERIEKVPAGILPPTQEAAKEGGEQAPAQSQGAEGGAEQDEPAGEEETTAETATPENGQQLTGI